MDACHLFQGVFTLHGFISIIDQSRHYLSLRSILYGKADFGGKSATVTLERENIKNEGNIVIVM
jgi:hypothetical protein